MASLIVVIGTGMGVLLTPEGGMPGTKTFHIRARQYAYDPGVIEVSRGDTVHIYLSSIDVVHGFYLEGYGTDAEIHPLKKTFRVRDTSQEQGYRDVEKITVVAEKVGKFRYRCSHTCGYLHPFMQGEFIVGPNYPFQAATGAAVGLVFAAGFLMLRRRRDRQRKSDETIEAQQHNQIVVNILPNTETRQQRTEKGQDDGGQGKSD